MKKAVIALSIAFLIISLISCEDDIAKTNIEITYPDSVFFGQNILSMPDSTTIISGKNYGLAANLGNDATMKVIINNLTYSDSINFSDQFAFWWISTGKISGWIYFDYDTINGSQEFLATTSGNIDIEVMFDSEGHCRLDYYENSDESITMSKYLFWE